MKKIIYQDQEFYYKIDDSVDWGWTNFYSVKETETENYGLFFSKTRQVPKFLFDVSIDIENPSYSKEEVRKKMDKAYKRYKRELEIERGEII